jgi:hypothetical protein
MGSLCGVLGHAVDLQAVARKAKPDCEELERLRGDAKLAGLRASQSGRYGQFGAVELKREVQRKIDVLIQHLLAGHNGKPCPAGDRPIVTNR